MIGNNIKDGLKSEYIIALEEQIEMYKKLNTLNDNIIKTKEAHIEALEKKVYELLELSKKIVAVGISASINSIRY